MNSTKFSVNNQTKKNPPKVKFNLIKEHILGKRYELSLVLCGDSLSKKLNRIYRKTDKPTNVLSFPISKDSGEIFINLSRLEPFGATHLFIHGCLHLKGMQHSDRMWRVENKILNVASNRRWY